MCTESANHNLARNLSANRHVGSARAGLGCVVDGGPKNWAEKISFPHIEFEDELLIRIMFPEFAKRIAISFSWKSDVRTSNLSCLLLVYDNAARHPFEMSKREVLEIFASTNGFLTPDRVWSCSDALIGDRYTAICCG